MSVENDAPICVRCNQPVIVSRADYETFERMHWLCFHLAYEHNADPDEGCDDPSCPIALWRAVAVLGDNEAHYQIAYNPDGPGWAATHDDWATDCWAASPAAALIALAEQVTE